MHLTESNNWSYLVGNAGKNLLSGVNGDDVLIGAGGADTLTGGKGADIFRFLALDDTGVGVASRDVITDFNSSQGDHIDLSQLDANLLLDGNQAFTYIGGAAFSAAGQLRFVSGVLSGDVNGDNVADFEIALTGLRSLAVSAVFV